MIKSYLDIPYFVDDFEPKLLLHMYFGIFHYDAKLVLHIISMAFQLTITHIMAT